MHLKNVQDTELYMAGGNIHNQSSLSIEQEEDQTKDNGVILDLNPEKYVRPKDHLFYGIYKIYG